MKPDQPLVCEASHMFQRPPATHIYGPECEATTGKLMYLCAMHTAQIESWRAKHANDPVACPRHGEIGKVKDYLVLTRIPT